MAVPADGDDGGAVAGHPNKADKALIAGFDGGFHGAARPQRRLPLDRIDQVV